MSKFEEKIHKADFGEIAEVIDPKSKSKLNTKMMYVAGQTPNGYCYKDYNTFQNDPDGVCYIAECGFGDDVLFVDYVNENKEKLIARGVISTRNSIKDEIREVLKHDEYYYKYEYNGIVHAIHSRDFEDGIIDNIAKTVFEEIDWQTSQAYTSEIDWCEDINEYYKKRLKSILNSFMGNKSERCEELSIREIGKYLIVAEELEWVDNYIGDDKVFYNYDKNLLEELSYKFEDSVFHLINEELLYDNNLHTYPDDLEDGVIV